MPPLFFRAICCRARYDMRDAFRRRYAMPPPFSRCHIMRWHYFLFPPFLPLYAACLFYFTMIFYYLLCAAIFAAASAPALRRAFCRLFDALLFTMALHACLLLLLCCCACCCCFLPKRFRLRLRALLFYMRVVKRRMRARGHAATLSSSLFHDI